MFDYSLSLSYETPMNASGPSQHEADVQRRMDLVVNVVCAFIGNNKIDKSELSGLIDTVNLALTRLSDDPAEAAPPPALVPAVPVKKSVTPDFIICLEDGRKFRSLKRHLRTLGMSPDEYRRKWGLPPDYPMVAPTYSEARSLLAKKVGLGNKAKAAASKVKGRSVKTASSARASKK